MAMSKSRTYGHQCGVARSLDVIGERWALLIVRELLLGPKRFGDLMAGLAGASPNVISQRLHELTGDGVIRQRELDPPARVKVYELTEWGSELEPVLAHLGQWGDRTPVPQGAPPSLDSLLLALRSRSTSDRLDGVYELRLGTDTIAVEADGDAGGEAGGKAGGEPGKVLVRHGRASREPDATVTTDTDTLRAVCFGQRTVEDAVKAGDLVMAGDDAAIGRLTGFLLVFIAS